MSKEDVEHRNGTNGTNGTNGEHLRRLETADMELGATDVVRQHITRPVVGVAPVSQRRLDFEHSRPRWLREMLAEATGVFFYVYPGIASTAAFILNQNNPTPDLQFSSMLQIGFAYMAGIAFAIITCASTSGGHFHPAMTLAFAIFQDFPWRKVPRYIFAQICGSFVAGLALMGTYRQQIRDLEGVMRAKGLPMVMNGGPASILCTFPGENQHNLGYLFLIEFVTDLYIGLVIWASLDPANPFMSPQVAPFAIGLAFCNMIWGNAFISIATNTARDLGTRLVAAIFYGGEAFTYRNYSWIPILTNIPATLIAIAFYELVCRDSVQKIKQGHLRHEDGEDALVRHLSKIEPMETGITDAAADEQTARMGIRQRLRGSFGGKEKESV